MAEEIRYNLQKAHDTPSSVGGSREPGLGGEPPIIDSKGPITQHPSVGAEHAVPLTEKLESLSGTAAIDGWVPPGVWSTPRTIPSPTVPAAPQFEGLASMPPAAMAKDVEEGLRTLPAAARADLVWLLPFLDDLGLMVAGGKQQPTETNKAKTGERMIKIRVSLEGLAYLKPVEYGTSHRAPTAFVRGALHADTAIISALGGRIVA